MRVHALYLIRNSVNGKVYVGQSVRPEGRWYEHRRLAGRFTPIQVVHKAIKKYGAENFLFEVVASCITQEDADLTEIALIEQYDCLAPKGYNVSKGGGSIPVELNRLGAQFTHKKVWADPAFRARASIRASTTLLRLHAEGRLPPPPSFTGKHHRPDSKALMGAANSIHQAGEGNSQFGTVWIYSTVEDRSCKVPGSEVEAWLKLGWVRGRKIKRKSV